MNRIYWFIFVLLVVGNLSAKPEVLESQSFVEQDTALRKDSDPLLPDPVISKVKTVFRNSDHFKLSGYGHLLYQASDNAEINNSMRVSRIILFAEGDLRSDMHYLIMYDFGPSAALHEFYLEYTPVKALSIRFGQYKIPFTLENPMSPTRWESIFGSLGVNALAGISTDVIGAKAGRDMGIQLSGKLFAASDFYRLEYYGGLFNGTGLNTPDNNNHKDFTGTVICQPLKGLKLSAGCYAGKARYAISEDADPVNHVRNRWTVGGEYSARHSYFRSEYIRGNDGGYRREGFYAVAMWRLLPDKLDIFGKYDTYDPDLLENRLNKTYEYTGGINYYIGYLSRIQLNYIHTDEGERDRNILAAQLQLFF
ncbi:MAG: OprO/OprP family phosphate-selective porin [Dysgonamonadaceae bacterium]|jgi:hypothetical protein|nr:OprO/OprP family phosphate-selective porin [Dysgonamonadaceae bacterium]